MYDELIKNLRGRSQFLLPHYREETSYDSDLMKQAADAIEELTGFVQEDERDRDEYRERLDKANDAIEELSAIREEQKAEIILMAAEDKPRWIPVTERLPEEKKAHYLCLLDDDSMAVVYWSKVPNRASKGEWAWHNPNWKEVTHWMPLPQPPKEE